MKLTKRKNNLIAESHARPSSRGRIAQTLLLTRNRIYRYARDHVRMQALIQHDSSKMKDDRLEKGKEISCFLSFFSQGSSSGLVLHPPPGHSPSSWIRFVGNLSAFHRDAKREARTSRVRTKNHGSKARDNMRLIAGEKELGGQNRSAFDGLLDSTECDQLVQLAQVR